MENDFNGIRDKAEYHVTDEKVEEILFAINILHPMQFSHCKLGSGN